MRLRTVWALTFSVGLAVAGAPSSLSAQQEEPPNEVPKEGTPKPAPVDVPVPGEIEPFGPEATVMTKEQLADLLRKQHRENQAVSGMGAAQVQLGANGSVTVKCRGITSFDAVKLDFEAICPPTVPPEQCMARIERDSYARQAAIRKKMREGQYFDGGTTEPEKPSATPGSVRGSPEPGILTKLEQWGIGTGKAAPKFVSTLDKAAEPKRDNAGNYTILAGGAVLVQCNQGTDPRKAAETAKRCAKSQNPEGCMDAHERTEAAKKLAEQRRKILRLGAVDGDFAPPEDDVIAASDSFYDAEINRVKSSNDATPQIRELRVEQLEEMKAGCGAGAGTCATKPLWPQKK